MIKTNTSIKPAQEDNAMNKSVTNLWNVHKSPVASGAATPIVNSGTATPAEVSTPIEEQLPILPVNTTPLAVETPNPESTTNKSKKRSKASKDSGSSSKRPKSKLLTSMVFTNIWYLR